MSSKVTIDRRRFVRSTLLGGSGLLLGFTMPGLASAATSTLPDCAFFQPNAFLRIDRKGGVTIFFAKQEIGQGVNTSLPMIIAEELEVDFQKVKTEIGPYGQYANGAHDTGGSQSVTGSWDELRKAGAVAKTMLIAAAAKRWDLDPGLCKAENGMVINASTGQSFTYGDLACDAAKIPVPTDVTLKNIKDFKIIGKEQRKKNLKDILTGQAKFGIDLNVPDMVYAVIERCPVLGGHLVSLDDSEALKVPGVLKVVRIVGTGAPFHVHHGVAVIATHSWAAMQGRRALKTVWHDGKKGKDSTDKLFAQFAKKAKRTPQIIKHEVGDAKAVKADKAHILEAEYGAPFLPHATMEPMNFIASVKGEQCELWGGLQLPDWAVSEISKSCNLKKENIRVNLALMGGGFGRRLQADFAIEAVKIAQQYDKPVKVIWDRSDDLRFDNFRPANYHRLRAKWNDKNQLLSWEHHVLTTPIEYMTTSPEAKDPSEMLGGASKDFWYDIPNVKMGYTPLHFNIHRGWLRGVEPVVNVFAIESFVDELAQKLGKDPLQFRLDMLEGRKPFEAKFSENWVTPVDPGRLAAVLRLAAEKIGWTQKRSNNRFVGIAGHMFFCDSYAAHAIEIERVEADTFRILKIVTTIDCGIVVNPDGLRSQMEGGTVFGLGQAIKNEITIKNSRVEQDSFFTFQMARYRDVPPIEVYALPSEARPGGAGEVAVATVSPALCNALAAAGMRPRTLPIKNVRFV